MSGKGVRGGKRFNSGRKPKVDSATPLSTALREIRNAAGMSGAQLGEKLGSSYMKVSRVENGHVVPDPELTEAWLVACGASRRLHEVQGLRRDQVFAAKQYWEEHPNVVSIQEEVGRLVASCDEILSYFDFVVPGLLQTPEYTSALFHLGGVTDPETLNKSVEVRQDWRKSALANCKQLQFVLGEAALKRPFGEALPAQLAAISEDSRRSNVDVRVLPSDVPTRVIPMHSFSVFGNELVMVELFNKTLCFRDQRTIDGYREIFGRLLKDANAYEPMVEVKGKAKTRVGAR